jgi:DNA polymerase V
MSTNSPYIGLIDCNNFFASCERIFDPSLKNKPLGILSNNDGCFIARSNELKALGVPMGAPYFQVKHIIDKHQVVVKSANFSLYSDISKRIMSLLKKDFPSVEIYSIDEAFIHFTSNSPSTILQQGKATKEKIYKWIGIPVSIGIAKTKTLAKVACKVSKQHPSHESVLLLESKEQIANTLKTFDIGDVWGIGREKTKFLKTRGIHKALDFLNLPEDWVKKHLSICSFRTLLELHEIPCLSLEEDVQNNKSILRSRTFGKPTTNIEDISEAIAHHVTRIAEILRSQNSLAPSIGIFIRTNPFASNPQYSQSFLEHFLEPTDYTPEFLQVARTALEKIFKPGYRYAKAGAFCPKVISNIGAQRDLFKAHEDFLRKQKSMQILDTITSKYGDTALFYASLGTKNACKRKQDQVSSRFTTNWNELAKVK